MPSDTPLGMYLEATRMVKDRMCGHRHGNLEKAFLSDSKQRVGMDVWTPSWANGS